VPAFLGSDADPDARDFIDPDWDPAERSLVADYLESGLVIAAAPGAESCTICGETLLYHKATDGTFEWPIGLAHIVSQHSVRLPDEVVRHIVARRTPPRLMTWRLTPPSMGRTVDETWWRAATARNPKTTDP
jgi:hypothetical protein